MSISLVIPTSVEDIYRSLVAYFSRPGAIIAKPTPNTSSGCLYRLNTPSGVHKCALGALIPDASYHESYESTGASAVLDQIKVDDPVGYAQIIGLGLTPEEEQKRVEFVVNAQKLHDSSETPAFFLIRLEGLAVSSVPEVRYSAEAEIKPTLTETRVVKQLREQLAVAVQTQHKAENDVIWGTPEKEHNLPF